MAFDLSFFLGPLLESSTGQWLSGQEARKNFENDVRLFWEKQKRDTSLDVFFFANRPDIRDDQEYLRLEDVYIPIRLRQVRESLPDREDFMRNFDVETAEYRIAPELPDDLNIGELLEKLFANYEDRKIMLIGNGGSGKSTFMKYLARFFAEKMDQQVRVLVENKNGELKEKQVKINHHYFPIFIRLRDLEQILLQHNSSNWEENFNLGHFLQAKHGLHFVTKQFYAKVLQKLPCLILLDGVDEVPEHKDYNNGLIISRRKIMNWINTQVKVLGAGHPKTSFILTSRPADLSLLARSFQVFELKSFSEGEIRLFAEYWYRAYEKMLHYCVRSEIHSGRKASFQQKLELLSENKNKFIGNLNHAHLNNLINNPLLLSQAILIHSIDESFELSDVDSLYEKFIDTLLYRWDDIRQMNFYPELLGNRNLHRLFQLMGRIAFVFSKREVTKMTFDDLLPEVVKAVSRFKNTLQQPDKIVDLSTQLLDVLRDRGGIFTGGIIAEERNHTEYEFQHKSIQDYLTAYTMANDNLWKSEGFDLLEVIDRKEFWGRTLEFFVNVKKSNPDEFFRAYLTMLAPQTSYAKKLHHFVQYFLLAQDKDPALEPELIQKCEAILMHSPDFIEMQIAQMILVKLPLLLVDHHLSIVQQTYDTLPDNFRAVKWAQLYFVKGKGLGLISAFRETSTLQQLNVEQGNFYRFRNYCLLGLLLKDYQVWKNFLIQEGNTNFKQLNKGIVLQTVLNLRALWDLRDLLALRTLQNLLNLRDLKSLRDLLELLDLLELQDLRDLQYLQNLIRFEQELEEGCQYFIQSSKFPIFLSEMKKISERFHSLTPEQKRQYFINVDE